ncbi:MAG: hypothetical protein EHM88_12345, partial [Candidatus Rokuibacteriota bacterium]
MERGQALGDLARPPGLGRAGRVDGDERSRSGARLRADRARLRPLGRARGGSHRAAGDGAAGAARRPRGQAPGPAQRHLQEAVTARRLTVIATGPSGPPEELDPLRTAGHEVVIGRPLDMPGRKAYSESDLIEQVRAADVLLASHLERVTPAVMEHAEHLGLVIVPFIGVDKIDVPAATRLGVLVANSPTKENFIAVAEATIGLILMLLKRVKRGESRLRAGEWARREDRGDFLFGKTVGIVGLGRIGTHVARRLAPWDVRLIAADPYVSADKATALGVAPVDLPTLLTEADIVTLHATLTDETRGFIGEKELRRMKPTA